MFFFPLVQFFSDPKKSEPGGLWRIRVVGILPPPLRSRAVWQEICQTSTGGSDGRSESCIWGILEAKTG